MTKKDLVTSGRKNSGYAKKKCSERLVSEDTFKLTEAKRAAKHKDTVQYKQSKAEVQKKVRQDNQRHLHNLCVEMEEAKRRGNMRKVYQTARALTHKFTQCLHCSENKNGEKIIDSAGVAEHWSEYCKDQP